MAEPLPWSAAKASELAGVRGVCLDIDDTLSTHGKLTAEAYSALWKLKQAGVAVVPVTGRPAGWCDHFARFWPVDAVVGENGAFTFYMDQNGVRRRLDTPGVDPDNQSKLEKLEARIRTRFPQARWASDQKYREFDLAIDFCEDVPAWPDTDVQELLTLCRGTGAQAKLSSIHVNTWYGSFDKRRGLETWLQAGAPGWKRDPLPWDSWLFIGDSPNDEPLFEAFRLSVGVANLRRYLPKMTSHPRWITRSESGSGFVEMVERLVPARSG